MAGHQTRVKKFCCIIPRQACHLVKLAVRHCARQVVILASHLLLVSRDPCLAVGAESDTSARTEGTRVEDFETILARGILLKEYLSLVFFASDWPSTDRRPLCTRTGALSLLLIDPPQVLCQVVVVVAVVMDVPVLEIVCQVVVVVLVLLNDKYTKKELKQLYMTN